MRKTFVILLAFASLAVLVGLTVVLGSAIGREITARMAELKARSIEAIESAIGSKVTYASISPSFLNYLEIRDLTIHDPADSSKPLLTIHRVRIYYSLVHLLARRDPVGSLREIRILNSRFTLDLQKDTAVIKLIQKLTARGGGDGGLRARITGADVDVVLQSGGTTLSISHLFFDMNAEKSDLTAAFRGDCVGVLPSGFDFSSSVNVEGRIDRAFRWSDFTVKLLSFNSSIFNLAKQTLQVVWKGSQVKVQKIQDREPIDLGLVADLDQNQVTVSFQTDGLRADKLVRFSNGLSRFNSVLSAPLTAAGHLTYSIPNGSLSYQIGVSAWFEDQLPVHDLTLDTTFTGTQKGVSFSPLRFSSPAGSLQFDGRISYADFYPEGILTLVNVDAGTGKRVSADLGIRRMNGGLAVVGRHMRIGEVGFDDFSIALSPMERGTDFTIESSFADTASGHISARGQLLLRKPIRSALAAGDTEVAKFPSITLSASLRDVPPDKLYHLLAGAGALTRQQEDLRSTLSRYVVTTDVDLTTDLSSLQVSSPLVTVTQVDDPTTVLHFAALVDSTHVAISDFAGKWKNNNVAGSLRVAFSENGQVGFSTDLTFLGRQYSFTGRYSDAGGLYAAGSYGLELNIAPNGDGTYSLEAKASKLPVPLGDSTTTVSFEASGLYSRPDQWVVQAPSFMVFDVPLLESRRNTFGFSARLSPRKLEIGTVTFTDAYSSLVGSAEAAFELPPDIFDPQFTNRLAAQFSGTLKGRAGAEFYSAQGSLKNGILGISVGFNGAPVERMRSLSVKGTLSGTGAVTGPLSRPSLALHVSLKDGRLGTDPISMEAQTTVEPDSVQLSALTITYLAHKLTDGAGTVDVRKGTYSLTAHYAGEYFSEHVILTASLQGQFNPRASSPLDAQASAQGRTNAQSPAQAVSEANLLDLGLQGQLNLFNISAEGTAFPPWGVTFRTERGRLTLDGGPGNSLHGSIDSHLAFAIHMSRPLPFVGAAGGRISGDQIVASVAMETFDVTVLNSVLKTALITTQAGSFPVLSFTSGTASGRLSVSGPVNDPDINGELDVVGCGVRSAYSPDDAGPIAAKLIFTGKEFHFPQVVAGAGASRLGAEASFTIDHWAPQTFDLTLQTQSDSDAHVRGKFGRMIADGHVQGTMRIAGDDTSTNVTGNVVVTDCRITLGQAPQGVFVPEEPPTFLTLNAETGKRVEFAWPSESYPVVRTTASPGGKLAITYRGDTGAYTVKGSAAVQGGEIYYFDRSFILRKGTIAFNEDQQNFDPRITARAEVREWDPSTGEEIRIYLDADNPLSKFTPRFTSDPPRSENYILAMIGAPFIAKAQTQGIGLSAALISSDVVSQAWLLRPLENRLRDALGMDMVSVRTQVIQNLLAQKIFGTALNPLDNTSISLGKYVGSDLFLEALVRLQTQPVPGAVGVSANSGVSGAGLPSFPAATLPNAGIGLTPQIEWSMEWTTPFFTFDWVFQPQHPETLYLTDNSLSFSWRFSY